MNTAHLRRYLPAIGLTCTTLLLGAWGAGCSASSDDEARAGTSAGVNNTAPDNNSANNSPVNNSVNNSSWNNSPGGNHTSNNSPANNNPVNNNPANNSANNSANNGQEPGGNTNVNLGGSQDFGYFRRLLDDGQVPRRTDIDAAGFFAEHHTPLPPPTCGERICVQPLLGVMNNMINGSNCTMLQVGLNSPLVADPDNRPPLTLAVVVDTSGSMNDNGKIEFVREGLVKLVNALNDDDQIALITYNSDVSTPIAMGEVRGRRNELQRVVSNLSAAGSTNIYDGLEQGYQTVYEAYDSGRQHRVIFLSDGEATVGNTNSDDILAMSRGYNAEGVGLTTVGLGSSFNFALMRSLAEQADGNYYFLESSAAVDEVFTEELSYFTVPVAFDLRLSIQEGSYYNFNRAVGSPFWEDVPGGGHMEIPSVFLAHRTSHDDVTEEGGRRGGGSALLLELTPKPESEDAGVASAEVASIDFQFREPGTDAIITDHIDVQYPHNPWSTIRTGFFDNAIVTKSFVMLNILVALELACDSFHIENTPEAGIELLVRVIAAASDYEDSANNGEGDLDIQADIALMEQLIDVMIARGAEEPGEVVIDEDPWPAD